MALVQVYVTWNGAVWLAKEKSFFDKEKAQDAAHPMKWWEGWRLLPEPVDGRYAAINAARTLWGDNGERWTAPAGPSITDQPDNVTVNEPNEATFSVAATGTGTLLYQWQVNSGSGWSNLSNTGPYTGVTTTTLSINPSDEALDGFLYRCVVTDDIGSTNSNSATLTVDPPVAVFDLSGAEFTFKKNNGEILDGVGVTLWVLSESTGALIDEITGLTTDTNGRLGIVPCPAAAYNTEYRVAYEFASGEYGVAKLTTEA